jgi:iron(III) transport system permease protein
LIIAPLSHLLGSFWEPIDDVFEHVMTYDFPESLWGTGTLVVFTVTFSIVIGVSLAALVSFFEYPGRRFFAIAFMAPMTIPTYVMAFIYIDLFDFSGPIQTWLREQEASFLLSIFPNVRSMGGCILVFSLCLYPYVYLMSCTAFRSISRCQIESSEMLGLTPRQTFFRLILPLAFPWIMSGAVLVTMETVADFGGVSAFNLPSFTTMIYKSWYGLGSFNTASRISLMLLAPALSLMALQSWLNRKKKFYSDSHAQKIQRCSFAGGAGIFIFCLSFFVMFFIFIVPLLQLFTWAFQADQYQSFRWKDLYCSIIQAGGSALILLGLVVPLVYAKRYSSGWFSTRVTDFCLLGYGLPGTVLAVVVYRWITTIDRWVDMESFYLGGTLCAIYMSMSCRFLSVAFYPVDHHLQRLSPKIDQASEMLGKNSLVTFFKVHLPILRGSMGGAAVLVFVDVMKEMPMTLMTRPLGWDTLSVRIYEFTSEGDWEHAAIPSLVIIACASLPLLLMKRID